MKRLLIDAKGQAVRTALTADDKLKELFVDAKTDGSLVGQVILGTVQNILPSQFVFIDIGREKNAFMNMGGEQNLRIGQPVLVQVYKDASGAKGANVGRKLHFNGRLVIVSKDDRNGVGVSQKIADTAERGRLRRIAKRAVPPGYGVILRTNSAGKSADEIGAEMARLVTLSEAVIARAQYARPPAVLYRDNSLLNDLLADDIAEIWVNDPTEYTETRQAVEAVAPLLAERVLLYAEDIKGEPTLFQRYGLEKQIKRALDKYVWLPCGGFVTFEQTEACVIVDVNTGKFAGQRNYRQSVLKTNMEAAVCIAEQVALRNLSGMIIVDFIDMHMEADKQALIQAFGDALKKDRIKTSIVGMTELGLVQLTRRKTRPPLHHLMERPCPHCGGTGRIPDEKVMVKGNEER